MTAIEKIKKAQEKAQFQVNLAIEHNDALDRAYWEGSLESYTFALEMLEDN